MDERTPMGIVMLIVSIMIFGFGIFGYSVIDQTGHVGTVTGISPQIGAIGFLCTISPISIVAFILGLSFLMPKR